MNTAEKLQSWKLYKTENCNFWL